MTGRAADGPSDHRDPGSGTTERAIRRRAAELDLLRAPGHLLRRNHQRSFEIFARIVGDDVTRQQFAVLIALAQRTEVSQRELVEATGIDKSTVKEMLTRMVARGWVDRERDPQDSRAWSLRIAPAGLALLDERLDAIAHAQVEILAPLGEAERRSFLRSLRILAGVESPRTGVPDPPKS